MVLGTVSAIALIVAAVWLCVSQREHDRIIAEQREFLGAAGLLRIQVADLEARVAALESPLVAPRRQTE